mmetsp:Transcript_72833/g.152083  ORF Transcript_72833/g.152083 Transcript_72833/m.152083 type:complete len:166 (+) Transcript_72833:116-613(+)
MAMSEDGFCPLSAYLSLKIGGQCYRTAASAPILACHPFPPTLISYHPIPAYVIVLTLPPSRSLPLHSPGSRSFFLSSSKERRTRRRYRRMGGGRGSRGEDGQASAAAAAPLQLTLMLVCAHDQTLKWLSLGTPNMLHRGPRKKGGSVFLTPGRYRLQLGRTSLEE